MWWWLDDWAVKVHCWPGKGDRVKNLPRCSFSAVTPIRGQAAEQALSLSISPINFMFMYRRSPQCVVDTCRSGAATGIEVECPSGSVPTTFVLRRASPSNGSIGLFVRLLDGNVPAPDTLDDRRLKGLTAQLARILDYPASYSRK